MDNLWQLYILRCADGSLYTGITVDVKKRLDAHSSGKGAKYTRGRGPLELVYQENCGSHSNALKREYAVKKLTKQEKEALISAQPREGCEEESKSGAKKQETELGNMIIRHGTIQDLDAVTNVEALCFPPEEAADRESFRNRLEVFPHNFWLLLDETRLVSFVNGMVTDEPDLTDEMYENAGMHNPKGKWQMIFGVNTLPPYRRRGYAARLLRFATEQAMQEGRQGVVLTCKEEKLRYYEKFGFQNEGITSKSTHGGAVWYQMRLTFPKSEEE